ncbi:hypothetical protein [Parvibaculum sp.]|jgi:hypothetical protein|uniref:DUF7064 domain-containing protein n=1 Tax=Parvibaculum sp. TaxID=2024848 RepID=UPI0025DCC877|nr:hypothetical protein [Parvibaculum sp.]|tara:strand:- start:36752 stop:37057 length:306 start_codon:yes stop_codon:yes gene_type:complete
MNFGRDFGMMISIVTNDEGHQHQGGMVLKDGKYDLIKSCTIDSDWDKNWYQTTLRAHVETESGAIYEVEGMTEYRCNGMTGYGLSEYLDQIVDGQPVGAGN